MTAMTDRRRDQERRAAGPLTVEVFALGPIVDAIANSAMQALAQELRRQGNGGLGASRPLRAAVREIVRRSLRNVGDFCVTAEAPVAPEPEPLAFAPALPPPAHDEPTPRSENADAPPVPPVPSLLSEPLVVRPRQACQMLSVGLTKLYELLNSGELESYLHGGSRRLRVASLHAYIERRIAADKAK